MEFLQQDYWVPVSGACVGEQSHARCERREPAGDGYDNTPTEKSGAGALLKLPANVREHVVCVGLEARLQKRAGQSDQYV